MTDKSYVPPIGRVLTPYLCCRDAAKAIEWYGEVLGAKLVWDPFVGPDGRIGHAELEVDGAVFMVSDAYPEQGVHSPPEDQPPTYGMSLYVPEVDATTAAAEKAGAKVEKAPVDMFHGSRQSTVLDPFGIRWVLATHLREVGMETFDAARAGFAGK